MPKVAGVVVGAFQENCWLVTDEATNRAVLVDPGDEGARLVQWVEQTGVTLDAIWLTHAHIDHVGGVAAVKRRWDVPVLMHPADRPVWDAAPRVAAMYGLSIEMPDEAPDIAIADGDIVRCGSREFIVGHFPGHAPGLCAFVGHGIALAGDLIFQDSIGRTDLPLSNPRDMQASLERFATLDPAITIYPGHGGITTLGDELATNPFLNGAVRVRGG